MIRIFLHTLLVCAISVTMSSCLFSCAKNGDPDNDTPVSSDVRDLANYKLVWSDEFDGEVLDDTHWNVEVNGDGGGNQELQYYRAENVAVAQEPSSGKSCLVLTAKKEDYLGRPATSGRVNSKGKYSFRYGRMDAGIKIPKTANGLWPAFWAMGKRYSWPSCGEIDIMEMGHVSGIAGGTQDRFYNGACHWGEKPSADHPSHSSHQPAAYSLQDDFTLWTLVWDKERIRMYLDLDKYPGSDPYFEMSINESDIPGTPGYYFHQSFYILFNLAVGGAFPQIFDIDQVTALNNGPASMYIDYVRVYKFKGT